MRKDNKPKVRRFAALLAAIGVLVMSSGLTLMLTATPANAGNVGTNQPEYWETLPGEQCVKNDHSANSGAVVVPAAPDGRTWTKLIIKKGSGNIGQENQVFENPVPGTGYTWVGNDPTKTGGWSHYILCSVPTPPTFDQCDNLPGDQPEGTACSHEPDVTFTDWQDQAWECDDTTTTQTRTKTTTTYSFVEGAWKPNAPVQETETQTRDLTPAEITECPQPPFDQCRDLPGDQPEGTPCSHEPDVTFTDWQDQAWECDDTTTTQTRTKTTTTYSFVEGAWKPNAPVQETETQTRDLTPAEITECPAPPTQIAVDIVFTNPTCANENTPAYSVTGDADKVTVIASVLPQAGTEITVTATAKPTYAFAGDKSTYSETYTYPSAQSPCGEVEPPTSVTPPAPTFVDPTCDVPTADVTYQTVEGVNYAAVGSIEPGAKVEITATPKEGFAFPEGATTSWEHTFSAAPSTCGEDVTPPNTVTPGGEDETDTPGDAVVTPTVVHAGLAGADPRGSQGLALLVAGLVLTVLAGGVAVRARN